MNVAVTAVGGGIGQSIIKSLKGTRYRTVGIDPKSDAAGLYMADTGYIGKNFSCGKFVDRLIQICKKEECKYIFPGLDAELKIFAKNADRFKREKITPIISSPETVELSDDKWKLYEFLRDGGLPHIKSALSVLEAEERNIPLPWILKPKLDGCRSKDVFVCSTEAEASSIIASKSDPFIIQEYIDGDEYTCGSVTFDKKILGTIQMKRSLRNGDTYKAYVVANPVVDRLLVKVLTLINPFGPMNIQLRVRDGIPYILEINARCSGTTASRTLAGFNEPEIVCDYLNGEKINYKIKEVAIFRYWDECVVGYNTIKEIEDEGNIHGSKWRVR